MKIASNSGKNVKALMLLVMLTLNLQPLLSQNNALNFDGSNDKVDISNSPSLNFAIGDQFSIEAWFNTTASGFRVLFSNRIDVAPFTGYEFMLNSGSVDFSIVSTNNSSMKVLTVNNSFNDGNWHHAVAVYRGNPNGNNVDIFVDGILQAKTVPLNTLSGTITNTNMATIGARQLVTAYNFVGGIDEVRIWNKALCAQEIVAKKNCNLIGTEYGLVAYYNFNQGIAAGNNSTLTSLTDLTAYAHTGTLTGFALSGATSNWVTSGSTVTGNCAPYGPLTVSGNTALCSGVTFSTTLTASGGVTYTWSTNANSSSIVVSPTVNTTYSVVAIDANTCTTNHTVMVTMNPLPNVTATTNNSLLCIGSTTSLTANGAATYTWSNNSNATSIIINPTVTTTYTLTGTSAAGCSNSITITESVTTCNGINQYSISDKFNLLVYPNPSNSNFNIKSDIDLKIKIVNELGMTIQTVYLEEKNGRMENIGNLSSGIYFLISDEAGLRKKIIVTK